MDYHQRVVQWSLRIGRLSLLELGQKNANELRQGVIHHALKVLHQRYYNLHGHDSIHLVCTRCVHDENSLHKFEKKLQIGEGLALTRSEQCPGVFGDVVLDAVGSEVEELKSKATIKVVVSASNDVHHLWKQTPHFRCNHTTFRCTMVNQHVNAVEAVFNNVHAVRSESVHQDRVNNSLKLLQIGWVVLGSVHYVADS